VSAWDAKKIEDYREIVEVLLGLQSLPLLQSRFYFWQRELNKNVPGNTKNERRDQWS
jgi:hypothetical protein